MRHYRFVFIGIAYLVACQNNASDPIENIIASSPDPAYANEVSSSSEQMPSVPSDTLSIGSPSVVFFIPKPEELKAKVSEPELLNGLEKAVEDFKYYALLIKDSLQARQIPAEISSKDYFAIPDVPGSQVFDRKESQYLMGAILNDGNQEAQFIYGLHTHLSWWELISNYFDGANPDASTLIEYFRPIQDDSLHIYSSHEKILDRFGNPIPPKFYQLFGTRVNQKALSRGMSIFAYYQFKIQAGQFGLICRIPSQYDESAIHLFIWDQSKQQIVDQLELAENLWHNDRITVKDSWLQRGTSLQIVQRSRQAWREDGQRKETDDLSLFTIANNKIVDQPAESLQPTAYSLHDWEQATYVSGTTPPVKAISSRETYWVDHDFVMDPLELGPLSSDHLITLLQNVKLLKEPVPNLHQPDQIDTLLTVAYERSFFKFYQSPDKELFIASSIEDDSPALKKGIAPGISKSYLAQQFGQNTLEAWPDTIEIGDRDRGRVVTCYFEADTLNRISIESYID